jgi:predicted N-acetyltransferase YhbS
MRQLSEDDGFTCRALRNEDEKKVKGLIKDVFGDFLDGEFWNWKYKYNPFFDPALVVVAQRNGELIGCNHWLLKNFMLSPTLETKAVLGGDIAVDPKCRLKGVGKALLHSLRTSEAVKKKKPSIVFMFADPSLAKHFHNPKGGYFPAPDRTTFYLKILHWRKLKENVQRLNEQIAAGKFGESLPKTELKVAFKIRNAPQLSFTMSGKGVEVKENELCCEKDSDITVQADLATLEKVGSRKNRMWNLFAALLSGKLRIRCKPTKLVVFYRNLWILKEVFGKKIF